MLNLQYSHTHTGADRLESHRIRSSIEPPLIANIYQFAKGSSWTEYYKVIWSSSLYHFMGQYISFRYGVAAVWDGFFPFVTVAFFLWKSENCHLISCGCTFYASVCRLGSSDRWPPILASECWEHSERHHQWYLQQTLLSLARLLQAPQELWTEISEDWQACSGLSALPFCSWSTRMTLLDTRTPQMRIDKHKKRGLGNVEFGIQIVEYPCMTSLKQNKPKSQLAYSWSNCIKKYIFNIN